MLDALRRQSLTQDIWKWVIPTRVLLSAAYLGRRPATPWLTPLVFGAGALVLLRHPTLGLLPSWPRPSLSGWRSGPAPRSCSTPPPYSCPPCSSCGSPGCCSRAAWRLPPPAANAPLFFFLLAALQSLLLGNVLWDPAVPKAGHFWLVQLAQWAIFAIGAGAFWLTANLIEDETWLRRATFTFIAIGGFLAVGRTVLGLSVIVGRRTSAANCSIRDQENAIGASLGSLRRWIPCLAAPCWSLVKLSRRWACLTRGSSRIMRTLTGAIAATRLGSSFCSYRTRRGSIRTPQFETPTPPLSQATWPVTISCSGTSMTKV